MANRPYPGSLSTRSRSTSGRATLGLWGGDLSGPDRPLPKRRPGTWCPKRAAGGDGAVQQPPKILVRLLSRNTNDRFDQGFWRRRLRYALDYRKTVMGPDYACCRLIFGRPTSSPASPWTGSGTSWSPRSSPWGWRCGRTSLPPAGGPAPWEDGVTVRAIYERSDAPPGQGGLPKVTGFYPPPAWPRT